MLGVIALLSFLSAGTEVLALVTIAPLVQAAADGETRYSGSLGPFELDMTITQLALFSGAMLVVALLVQIFTTYASSRLTSGYYVRTRLEVVRAFQNADWGVQSQEREGWLRTLSTENVDAAGAALLGLIASRDVSAATATVIGIGFCGALTTYSSFALEVRLLGPRYGLLYVTSTLVCVTGAASLATTL